MAPITLVFGPIASLNFLAWLTFTSSALAMFLVLKKLLRWQFAAFIGGALYGFSPYMVGQGYSHVALDFVAIPPIVLFTSYELLVTRDRPPMRLGALIGILFVIQYFIFSEIAFTMAIALAVGLLAAAIVHPSQVLPAVRHARGAFAVAIGLIVVLLAYPLWVASAGPYRFSGSAHAAPGGGFAGISADLAASVVPTTFMRFAPSSWIRVGSSFSLGDYAENGSYLGIPLILLILAATIHYRRHKWIIGSFIMAMLMLIISLGPYLVVYNHFTSIPLPFRLVMKLPLFQDVEPVRFSLYEYLFIAVLCALALDIGHTAALNRKIQTGSLPKAKSRRLNRRDGYGPIIRSLGLGTLAVAAALALVPRWPFPTSATGIPPYFTSKNVNKIPLGSVALISPYPSVAELQPVLWQAVAKMRFRLIGGYGFFRTQTGGASLYPAELHPYAVEEWMWTQVTGSDRPFPGTPPPPLVTPQLYDQTQTFLHRYHVGVVVWTNVGTFTASVYSLFVHVLGQPDESSPTVAVWYDVQRDVAASHTSG